MAKASDYEFVLEISDSAGEGLADEEHCLIRSDSPLPIPSVGDHIRVGDVVAEVKYREFAIYGSEPVTIAVQVFCKDVKAKPRAGAL